MDPLFIRGAAFPPIAGDRPVILGLRLHPLSLGHQFLLLSIDSPLADGRQAVNLHDFFLAIFFCAQPWREAERTRRAWWLPWYFRLWRWKNRRTDVAAELARFREWYAAEIRPAEFRTPVAGDGTAPSTRACGAPGPYVRLLFLLTTLRLSEERALDLPVATATALYSAWLDTEGHAQLTTDADREFWAAAEAEDAKRFNADGSRKETGNSERETRNGEPGTGNKEVGKTA